MNKINISKPDDSVKNIFAGFKADELSPRGKKLLKEWKKIDDLCEHSEVIKYIVRKRNREGLPIEYEIIYHVKSIVGVEEAKEEALIIGGEKTVKNVRKPLFGYEHRLSIALPNNYPSAFGGNPEFKMATDTWHPNIRATGKFKGRICLNDKDLGVTIGLDQRILRVGKYLQYQTYWATDSYPWPEDQVVAEWIREEAEPAGWVNLQEGIYIDNAQLFNPNYIQERQSAHAPEEIRPKPADGDKKQIIIKKK